MRFSRTFQKKGKTAWSGKQSSSQKEGPGREAKAFLDETTVTKFASWHIICTVIDQLFREEG